MVTEIVRATSLEGDADLFQRQLRLGLEVLLEDPGCLGVRALQQVEDPHEFVAEIEWESIEAHLAWRDGPGWPRYSDCVTPYQRHRSEFAHYEEFFTAAR